MQLDLHLAILMDPETEWQMDHCHPGKQSQMPTPMMQVRFERNFEFSVDPPMWDRGGPVGAD